MKLFVGLGNPGAQYALNRHNVGFMAVDAIAAAHDFPAWRKPKELLRWILAKIVALDEELP